MEMAQPQLTLAQRYNISAYLQAGSSKHGIAYLMNIHHSTVFREIGRNSVNGRYNPEAAHRKSKDRRQNARKFNRISQETWNLVEKLVSFDFSPEQIGSPRQVSGYLKRIRNIDLTAEIVTISHEWIYKHLLVDKQAGGDLWRHLRWSQKKRRKRYGKKDLRGLIPGRVSIDERPEIVCQKIRIGDWEIDTATGRRHKGVIVVAVERKSKLVLIEWVPKKQADLVAKAIIRMLKPYRDQVKAITVDNGKEFSFHQKIAKALKAEVYFAHPYSAWERGLNENTIGLIRQYFPKNMSLEHINKQMIQFVQNQLNIRPRKTLGYRSPNDVFLKTVAFGT
jgi:IS30 family transposase